MRAYLVAELIDGHVCWGAVLFALKPIVLQNNLLHAIYSIKSVASISY
jgi:hypothetical protein